jgi:hypothetical protein
LRGVLGSTVHRVTTVELTISAIDLRLTMLQRKQEEVDKAWENFRATLSVWALVNSCAPGGQDQAHSTALFLGCVQQLQASLKMRPQAGPMEVVTTVLHDIQM